MLPAISCAASWATVRRRPSWRARPTSRTGSWLAWSILESGRGKSPPSRSPCAGHGARFLGGRPNRKPISSELGLCCAAVRRGYWLRVDFDDLRRAGGLARHAVDAVRLPDHVGLVASILVPLLAAFLNDLVVPRAFLARGEKPLEDVDGADVHADAVGDAAVEVDGHVEAVDPEFRWIRVPVGIGPRDALGKDLVVEVGPCFGVFVRLVHEVGIDRFRGEIHFTRVRRGLWNPHVKAPSLRGRRRRRRTTLAGAIRPCANWKRLSPTSRAASVPS